MKVRASVLREIAAERPYSKSQPLSVELLDLEGPRAGDVLIRVLAAGLCHSDLSAIDGVRPRERTPLPIILGHEAAGEVVEIGPGVDDLAAGDRVVTTFVPSCGHCVPCMAGRPALCEPAVAFSSTGTLATGGTRFSCDAESVYHYVGVAAYAEMTVCGRNSLVKVDDDVPPPIAALFGCAVLTGVGAVVNTARVRPGESVAIFGLGGVGLSALLGAHVAGAGEIVVVDPNENKLQLARELGATLMVDAADPDCVSRIREWTRGGVDHAFEMAGAAKATEAAYRVTRRGGTTVIASFPAGNVLLPVSQASLVGEERTIKGSYFGSAVPVRDVPRLVRLFKAGRLPVDRIADATVGLDGLNAAFDSLAEGNALRQILVP